MTEEVKWQVQYQHSDGKWLVLGTYEDPTEASARIIRHHQNVPYTRLYRTTQITTITRSWYTDYANAGESACSL